MGKLRVFISSTMKDLVNERRAVVMRLREFNQEPVNAENWLPDGSRSWTRIAQEIGSSDLFVLILGERYGWVPDSGPGAESGRSVTHLEFEEARRQDLPILVFAKNLPYDADRTSAEARQRDSFRQYVMSWDAGVVTRTFDDAFDLGPMVGQAVIDLLTDEYQRSRIAARASAARSAEAVLVAQKGTAASSSTVPVLPPRLIDAVANRNAVLFAGAGISLAAGLPSAAAFAQSLLKLVQKYAPAYEANPVGTALAGIATDVENLPDGRAGLLAVVQQLVHPPQGLEPTRAHADAVQLFDTIVTTNYDTLFEKAAAASGRLFTVTSNELAVEEPPRPGIVNLHGQCSASDLRSLVLTERDVLLLDRNRPLLWNMARQLLATRLVIVLGSSLRDPSVVRLFTEALPGISGYFVAPKFWPTTARRVRAWNLECIETDAAGLFQALFDAVGTAGTSAEPSAKSGAPG